MEHALTGSDGITRAAFNDCVDRLCQRRAATAANKTAPSSGNDDPIEMSTWATDGAARGNQLFDHKMGRQKEAESAEQRLQSCLYFSQRHTSKVVSSAAPIGDQRAGAGQRRG